MLVDILRIVLVLAVLVVLLGRVRPLHVIAALALALRIRIVSPDLDIDWRGIDHLIIVIFILIVVVIIRGLVSILVLVTLCALLLAIISLALSLSLGLLLLFFHPLGSILLSTFLHDFGDALHFFDPERVDQQGRGVKLTFVGHEPLDLLLAIAVLEFYLHNVVNNLFDCARLQNGHETVFHVHNLLTVAAVLVVLNTNGIQVHLRGEIHGIAISHLVQTARAEVVKN